MYAVQLEYALVEAYEHVHKCTGIRKRCQKQFYNRKVYGLAQKWVPRYGLSSLLYPGVPQKATPPLDWFLGFHHLCMILICICTLVASLELNKCLVAFKP